MNRRGLSKIDAITHIFKMHNESSYNMLNDIRYDPFPAIRSLFKEQKKANHHGSIKFQKDISSLLKKIHEAYYGECDQVLYKKKMERLAYFIQHVPIGIFACYELSCRLESSYLPNSLSLYNPTPLNIVSIGSGPGTDIFGFLLSFYSLPRELKVTRIDLNDGWNKYYKSLRKDFSAKNPEFKHLFKYMKDHFIKADISDISRSGFNSSELRSAIKYADIIILNRVLSDFRNQLGKIPQIIRQITRKAKDDALLLFLDINFPERKDFVTFRRCFALIEGFCRQGKPNSTWIAPLKPIDINNFKWKIPAEILKIQKYGHNIKRSGHFLGGIVWLKR